MVQWWVGVGEGVGERLPEGPEVPELEWSSDGSGDSRGSGLLDGAGPSDVGDWRTGTAGGAAWGLAWGGVDSGVGLGAECTTDLARSVQTAGLVLPVAAHAVRPRMPVKATASAAGASRQAPTLRFAPADR